MTKSLNKKITSMLRRIYYILVMVYFDLVRDPIIALSRATGKNKKALILDMDWYRWCFSEHEAKVNLYGHPLLARHADFIRIGREQVFKRGLPDLNITQENYTKISHEGFNLWGICKVTIISNLGTFKIDLDDPSHLKEVERTYGEAVSGIDNLGKLYKRLNPDSILICQGAVFDSRCVVETARRSGINVVGIENSMVGGMVILDNLSGQIINRHSFARTGSEILETWEVTDSERDNVFGVWREKLLEKADEHKTGGIDDVEEIRKELDLPEGHKVLLLLGQVRTDASIVLDSTIYKDPVHMIEGVANYIQKLEDTTLIIRLHPKEYRGTSPSGRPYDRMTYKSLIEKGIDRLPNIKIIEDPRYNTYALMELADAGVTVNSQAGLEMCMLGKPVMVCGNAFYGNKGFTVDLGHHVALGATLDFLVRKAVMTSGQHRAALNFFYFFYHRHMFDVRLSKNQERLMQIFRLRLASN